MEDREVIWLRISAETPLLLGDESSIGNFRGTADFIAGSSLRGALAEKLLQQSPADFAYLFSGEEPYFGPAYLGGSAPVWPFPLTAYTCKRYGGLAADSAERKRHHGVIDMMLPDFAYDLISDPHFPHRTALQRENGPAWHPHSLPDVRQQLDSCVATPGGQVCGHPMVPASGYYAWGSTDVPRLKVQHPQIRRTTHVGINRARSVAQDQLLFTQERLVVHESSDVFFAQVTVPLSKVESFRNVIEGTYYVGRGRTRGNGRIIVENQPGVAYLSLTERLRDFNVTLPLALQPYQRVDGRVQTNLPGTFFSITLRSPAILHEAGRPLRVPTATMLGLSQAGQIVCLRAWARFTKAGGWDSASRLPRRKALAVRAGSAYLFWAPAGVDQTILAQELRRAELNGLGEERERGYGQLTVCAPFHYIDFMNR